MAEWFWKKTEAEPKKEKRLTAEQVGRLIIGGLTLVDFGREKGSKIKQSFNESLGALRERPSSFEDITLNFVAQFAKTVTEYEREDLEKGMAIRNRTIKSVIELKTEEEKAAALRTGFKVQREVRDQQIGNLSAEKEEGKEATEAMKDRFQRGAKAAEEKKRNEAEKQVEKLFQDLVNQLRS